MRNFIQFWLNGKKKEVSGELALMTFSNYLRYEQQLTGTKVVCAEGDCGACTIMVARNAFATRRDYFAVNSCIAMTFAMDGCHIVTVEGLNENKQLSEVQNSMVRNFGGQCGFCTPGFVMAITNLHEHKKNPTEQNVKNYLTGNLCRCTGYAPIIKAALDVDATKHKKICELFPLHNTSNILNDPVHMQNETAEFYAPISLAEAVEYKRRHPNAMIFSGSTDLGVQYNKGFIRPDKILSLHLIPELYENRIADDEVFVGARVTLNELEDLISNSIPALSDFLHIFASPQIKQSATLIGNLANASPIADTTPVMMALDAVVHVYGSKGLRKIPLDELYIGYKKLSLSSEEIIKGVSFRIPDSKVRFKNLKVSQRRDMDISTVNASFMFHLQGDVIQDLRIVYGGVGPTTIRLKKIENNLRGKVVSSELIAETKKEITDSVHPISDVRASADYRKLVVGNIFQKFADENLL
jgi:xanthine dehydrogenase small subunit